MTQDLQKLRLLGLALALGWAIPVHAQPYFPSLLQSQDQGDSVTEVQQNLAKLGYYSAPVTGNFDSATQEAVMRFQQANGLTADGIVGAATQAALNGGASGQVQGQGIASTSDSSQVSALQQQLTQLGYYKGSATGVFDQATQAAVVSFQQDRGLAADGIVGRATASALSQSSAQQPAPAAETTYTSNAATNGLLQLGDTGSEVSDLQSRLQTLGYYSGPISGSFGSQTQVALTAFQQAQGLTADGIAGPQVNAALATSATVAPAAQPTVSPVAPAVSTVSPAPAGLPAAQAPAPMPVVPTEPMTPPSASVQVPGVQVPSLPPAFPEAATPSQVQPVQANRPLQSDRFGVAELQRRLQSNGFKPAEVTGEYDAATQSAINQAQQSYGLSGQDFSN